MNRSSIIRFGRIVAALVLLYLGFSALVYHNSSAYRLWFAYTPSDYLPLYDPISGPPATWKHFRQHRAAANFITERSRTPSALRFASYWNSQFGTEKTIGQDAMEAWVEMPTAFGVMVRRRFRAVFRAKMETRVLYVRWLDDSGQVWTE